MFDVPTCSICKRFCYPSDAKPNASPCTEEEGGALFNAGSLEVYNIDFTENVAGENGLALRNGEPEELVLLNVTFRDNLLRCPTDEFNTDDVSRPYS